MLNTVPGNNYCEGKVKLLLYSRTKVKEGRLQIESHSHNLDVNVNCRSIVGTLRSRVEFREL